MPGDYLELNVGDFLDGETVDLWVTCRDRAVIAFTDVVQNPIRYQGTWTIAHQWMDRPATSYLPAEDVWYFTVAAPAGSPAPRQPGPETRDHA